jgi:hypothetical protein
MKRNVGNTDRIVRMLLGFLFATLYLTNAIQGYFGIGLLIFGGLLILTSLIGFCPLYPLLGVNTCKKDLPQ